MFSAIDPVSTSIVGHSLELEWEDTYFTNRWTRHCGASRLQRRLGVDTGNCCGGSGCGCGCCCGSIGLCSCAGVGTHSSLALHMFTPSGDLCGAPGLVVVNTGDPGHIRALVVDNAQVSEGEHAGITCDGGAGGLGQVLRGTGRGLGVSAIAPVVGDHCPIRVHLGGTPWGGGAGVGALVVLNILVLERKHTDGVIQGLTGVGNSSIGLGSWEIQRAAKG